MSRDQTFLLKEIISFFHSDLALHKRKQTKWRCSQTTTSWIMWPVFSGNWYQSK